LAGDPAGTGVAGVGPGGEGTCRGAQGQSRRCNHTRDDDAPHAATAVAVTYTVNCAFWHPSGAVLRMPKRSVLCRRPGAGTLARCAKIGVRRIRLLSSGHPTGPVARVVAVLTLIATGSGLRNTTCRRLRLPGYRPVTSRTRT